MRKGLRKALNAEGNISQEDVYLSDSTMLKTLHQACKQLYNSGLW